MLQVLGRPPKPLAVKILLGYIPVNMEVSRDIARIARTAKIAKIEKQETDCVSQESACIRALFVL
jgi:hypothetical protein